MRRLVIFVLLLMSGCRVPDGGAASFFTSQESTVSDKSSAYYATFLNAAETGALNTGRLPRWVPTTATGINETHSVDTVQSLLAFNFDPGDLEGMTRTCQDVSPQDVQFPALVAEWWPEGLRGSSSSSAYALYECPDEMGFLAVTTDGKAYFWIP